ncbi:ABC transporter substrate-binding protein, partial [Elioraea sp. Yellowstone]
MLSIPIAAVALAACAAQPVQRPGAGAVVAAPSAAGLGAAPRPLVGPDGKLRAALLLPLSGPHAAVGEALLNGAQLALFEHGAERIELLPKDTAGDPARAASPPRPAKAVGAGLVLGARLAHEADAVAPLAGQAAGS